jgi:hypothetical protein
MISRHFGYKTKIPIETTGTPPVFLSGKCCCSLHFYLKKYDSIILKGFYETNGPDSPDFKG